MKLSQYREYIKTDKITLDGDDYYKSDYVDEVFDEVDSILRDVNSKIDDITTGLY